MELGIPEGKRVVLFVGRFVERKGINELKEMIPHFEDVIWLLAGWGKIDPGKWGFPNMKIYLKLNALQLARLYQVADLLVVPDAGAGFPLVIQESMSCGTPALVAPVNADACGEARNLLFSEDIEGKDAVNKWIKKIKNILEDFSYLEELRPKLAAFSRVHWDWQRCAQEYWRVFWESITHRAQGIA